MNPAAIHTLLQLPQLDWRGECSSPPDWKRHCQPTELDWDELTQGHASKTCGWQLDSWPVAVRTSKSLMVLWLSSWINATHKSLQTPPASEHCENILLHFVTWTLLQSGNYFRYSTNSHLQQLVWTTCRPSFSISESLYPVNPSPTCSTSPLPHLQFHSSGKMLPFAQCRRPSHLKSTAIIGQFPSCQSSVGRENASSSVNSSIPLFWLLPPHCPETNMPSALPVRPLLPS